MIRQVIAAFVGAIALACMAPGAMAQEAPVQPAPAVCQTNQAQVEQTFKAARLPYKVFTGDQLKAFDDLVASKIGQHAPAGTTAIIIMDPTAEGFPEDAVAVIVGAIDVNGCMIGSGRWPVQFVRAILIALEPV